MLSGLALLLLVCLHMRVQGKPRSQVGPASILMGPGGTWEKVGIPIDANALPVRVALHDALLSVSLFWALSLFAVSGWYATARLSSKETCS